MHTAIARRRLAVAAVCLVAAGAYGCYRGDSLLDPSSSAGYRPPETHVTAITLTPTSVTEPVGQKVQILAAPLGPTGVPVAADLVAWTSSDPKAASVSGSGLVWLAHRGSSTITAIADGVTASVAAVVEAAPAASLTVTPGNTLIPVGSQVQLTVVAYDAAGAIDSGVAVTWSSSNSGVATVSAGGLVTAIAVGVATVSVASGSVSVPVTITVTSSAPTVASVSVAPLTSSLYPGGSEQLTSTLRDAAGDVVSGIAVAWSTSDAGIVSVSSTGVATANAIGSATITATADGQSGSATVSGVAPVVASVSVTPATGTIGVGQQEQFTATPMDASGTPLAVAVSWTSTDAGVASVSGGGLVTGNAAGSATIAATAGGVSGDAGVTVQSGPPGGYHEPSGMAVQINTGPITSTSAVTTFSPSTTSPTGEWIGNLSVVPGGTGLQVTYRPNLAPGNSPVRFGLGVRSPGTGWYYQRMKVRFSSNWTNANNPAIKLCEPRTQQSGSGAGATENHVLEGYVYAGPLQSFLTVALQGPNSQARNLYAQPATNPHANLSDGNWHVMEVAFGPESSPGAGNGTYQAWLDGTPVASYSNVNWLARGNNVGWPYLMFDPTYGGTRSSPPATMYWDVDQIYVSTK